MLNFEGVSLILKDQSVNTKYTWVCLLVQLQFLEHLKIGGYLRLNFHIRIVVVFAETQILIFAIKYVC